MNGDELAEAKKVVLEHEINWRSFTNGHKDDPNGTIFDQWRLISWPTIYVIDARGRIRNNSTTLVRPEKNLNQIIETCLAEIGETVEIKSLASTESDTLPEGDSPPVNANK